MDLILVCLEGIFVRDTGDIVMHLVVYPVKTVTNKDLIRKIQVENNITLRLYYAAKSIGLYGNCSGVRT